MRTIVVKKTEAIVLLADVFFASSLGVAAVTESLHLSRERMHVGATALRQ